MKVDNHIHLAAAASAKQFVNFVKNKLETEGDTVVYQNKTLSQVFSDAGLDSDYLTIDAFNVLADYSVYQRFDNFNSKYSPFRLAHMRKIFLKVDNVIKGRYVSKTYYDNVFSFSKKRILTHQSVSIITDILRSLLKMF